MRFAKKKKKNEIIKKSENDRKTKQRAKMNKSKKTKAKKWNDERILTSAGNTSAGYQQMRTSSTYCFRR